MARHLIKEIETLKKKLLSLSALVEESVKEAVKAVEDRDHSLVEKVIATDDRIDELEIEVEEDCLKILALHQPVAVDLRFLVAVLKINNELERIGDLSVNIAERAEFLATQPKIDVHFGFGGMFDKSIAMVKKSLDALVNWDPELGAEVCRSDDEIDQMNRNTFDTVKSEVRKNPENIDILLHLLSISRHLERIADHATNIAEDVIYMSEGEIVRHRKEDYRTHQSLSAETSNRGSETGVDHDKGA